MRVEAKQTNHGVLAKVGSFRCSPTKHAFSNVLARTLRNSMQYVFRELWLLGGRGLTAPAGGGFVRRRRRGRLTAEHSSLGE